MYSSSKQLVYNIYKARGLVGPLGVQAVQAARVGMSVTSFVSYRKRREEVSNTAEPVNAVIESGTVMESVLADSDGKKNKGVNERGSDTI